MTFRFHRRLRLFPGVRLNFAKRSVSVSVGPRGADVNVSTRGNSVNVGLPGSGWSWRSWFGKRK